MGLAVHDTTETAMHVLSIEDIELIVHMIETESAVTDFSKRQKQIDNLIKTGYVRPLAGVFVLTELGRRTASSLQTKSYVRSKVETPQVPAKPVEEPPALETSQ
jgi:RNA polymerase-interacting CarD/CdnL/TRCF family regulator